MKKSDKKHIDNTLFVLILIFTLSLGLSICFTMKKKGFYIDEGMTLFLSNGIYNGAVTTNSESTFSDFLSQYVLKDTISDTVQNVKQMLLDVVGKGNYSAEGSVDWYDAARSMLQGQLAWTKGSDLYQQIVAEPGNRFQYGQVYINQAMDVHPPLYYMFVHTIFSIFSNQYSKYFLALLNATFLLATAVLLYYICMKWWGKQELALLAASMYCFSNGFFSCTVYFRMYALLTFFSIMALYFHGQIVENDKQFNKKYFVLLCSCTILGSWVHYYFYVVLAPMVLINLFFLWKDKNTVLKKYFLNLCVSAAISLCVWPFSLYHVLFSYRGTEATQGLIQNSFIQRAIQYWDVIKTALFGSMFGSIIILVCVISSVLVLVLSRIGKKKYQETTRKCIISRRMLQISFVLLVDLFVMIQATPVASDRYIFNILPLLCICLVWLMYQGYATLKNQWMKTILLVAFVAMLLFNAWFCIHPTYLFSDIKNTPTVNNPQEYNVLMVLDDDASGYAYVTDLVQYQEVLSIGIQDVELLKDLRPRNVDLPVVVYTYGYLDDTEVRKTIVDNLGFLYEENLVCKYPGINAFVCRK